ncbi:unnamed protein product [Arctia plantaginis]|uniref:Uncharacterized protein n=1 Tax=Arctia plantaginis TaxID=874455 RepID=A0A8S0YT86_ARCPL|nr:unnamed protein product [Arctia plantaginis]CAB3237879.1 unnamed protein product [Arctia plantaginis]
METARHALNVPHASHVGQGQVAPRALHTAHPALSPEGRGDVGRGVGRDRARTSAPPAASAILSRHPGSRRK